MSSNLLSRQLQYPPRDYTVMLRLVCVTYRFKTEVYNDCLILSLEGRRFAPGLRAVYFSLAFFGFLTLSFVFGVLLGGDGIDIMISL